MAFSALRNLSILVASATILLVSSTAASAAPPDLTMRLVNSQQRLSSDQEQTVREYIDFWVDELRGSDVNQRFLAAEKLIDPPSKMTATVRFLETYSDIAVGPLSTVITDGNEMQAVQAMRALAFLGTYDALDLAANHTDSLNESRDSVRLWAAKASGQLIRRTVANASINVGQLDRVVDSVARAALAEEDWLTLHWMLDALFAADIPSSHRQQIRVFDRLVERMTSNNELDVNLVWVAHRAVVRIRELYLAPQADRPVTKDERTTYVRRLAPALGRVLAVASSNWDSTQTDSRSRKILLDTILGIETMLTLADTEVRPGMDAPPTSLARTWEAGNKDGFSAGVNRWNAILTRSPYDR